MLSQCIYHQLSHFTSADRAEHPGDRGVGLDGEEHLPQPLAHDQHHPRPRIHLHLGRRHHLRHRVHGVRTEMLRKVDPRLRDAGLTQPRNNLLEHLCMCFESLVTMTPHRRQYSRLSLNSHIRFETFSLNFICGSNPKMADGMRRRSCSTHTTILLYHL